MVFDFIGKTAQAAVDLTCDTAGMVVGGEGPKREDVAQLLAAGMAVAAVAATYGVAESAIEALASDE